MKVFFAGSYQQDPIFLQNYKKIYEEIGKLGYQHIDDEAVNLTYEEFVKKMEGGKDKYNEHFKNKIKAIQGADICIFEVSHHSLGVGFAIEKALELNKPTIILYYKTNIPYFLSGVDDEKLIVLEYSEKTIKKVIKDALDNARERRDKRFNFFISPKLLDYLEKASTDESVTKSKFIRNLIVKKMRQVTKKDES